MIRRIALGSLAATVLAGLALAVGQQEGGKKRPKPQDPWAEEKKDPKFADVDWNAKPDPPQLLINSVKGNGPDLYSRYCVQCHGEKGDGKGELSPMLIPPARDFTKGIFKGRSSHPELPPTSTDLMRSMIHGIPLSSMLSYSFIGTPDQVALIGQLQDLAEGHFPKGFGFPLKSGNFHRDAGMPFPTPETIARGRALFDRFNCVACHGEKGDGKGRVSDTLVDMVVVHDGMEFERPSSVRDFTQGVYSGGPNVRHMYLRVSGGVQGSVMPPFATSVPVEDRWALTHYVMSLSERSKPLPLPHSEAMIAKRAAKLPAGPDDPAWAALEKEKLPPREPSPFLYEIQPVYVLDLYFHQLRHDRSRPYFTEATARAIHDGTSIAVRLEWEDAASGPGDRIEFQLSPNKPPNPPGFVVYGSERDPVNVWRWDVKNPAAAEELDAAGPFTAKPQAASNVEAKSSYDPVRKRWAVVFTRSLAGGGGTDAPITVGEFNPFLILMKDGGDAWPQGTREIKADPEDYESEIKKAQDHEAARLRMEKEIEEKFKGMPRHLTTWHNMRLE